jgi:hypothetical protein
MIVETVGLALSAKHNTIREFSSIKGLADSVNRAYGVNVREAQLPLRLESQTQGIEQSRRASVANSAQSIAFGGRTFAVRNGRAPPNCSREDRENTRSLLTRNSGSRSRTFGWCGPSYMLQCVGGNVSLPDPFPRARAKATNVSRRGRA